MSVRLIRWMMSCGRLERSPFDKSLHPGIKIQPYQCAYDHCIPNNGTIGVRKTDE
jgi:hypothetical protein